MRKKSLDTETTGTDVMHGARPFFVSICDQDMEVRYWQWRVDPLDRTIVPETDEYDLEADLREIIDELSNCDVLALQNAPFDYKMLFALCADHGIEFDWNWDALHDTLFSAHLLRSNQSKDLTTLATLDLDIDISGFEAAIDRATNEARRYARSKHKDWRIAKKGLEEMPGAGEKCGRADMWLPREIAIRDGLPDDHEWHTVCRDYCNTDSGVTLPIHEVHLEKIRRRGLENIYNTRRRLVRNVVLMERRGIPVNMARLNDLERQFENEAMEAEAKCVNLAGKGTCLSCDGTGTVLRSKRAGVAQCDECGGDGVSKTLEKGLPAGGSTNALRRAVFENLEIKPAPRKNRKAKTETPSIDKAAIEWWLADLPPKSRQYHFIKNLAAYRKRRTALSYMEGYRKYGVQVSRQYLSSEWLYENCAEPSGDSEGAATSHGGKGRMSGMDEKQVRQRVRPVQENGGDSGTQSKLSGVQGPNTGRASGASQVRQPAVHKPTASVPRNATRQHEGHDREGQGRQGSGHAASDAQADGSGRSRDAAAVRQRGGNDSRADAKFWAESSADVRRRQAQIMEALAVKQHIILCPSLNATGTKTLRWSSKSPNEQNISKQEDFNIRDCFGPLPGREWWSLDAKNIELRIPAYESGEQALIDLFERPDDPPYYGSTHLLNFHTVYPDIWNSELDAVGFEKVGPHCKKKYVATWYQWCKNGGFCKQYGGQQALTDATFKRPGAYELIEARFEKLSTLNSWCIGYANRLGYIETIPDTTVDPDRGYPLWCTQTEYGGILPTVPLNYRTQGTAMWWTMMGMLNAQVILDEWNADIPARHYQRHGYHMVMQVHDELVFDFPKAADPVEDPERSNLWRIKLIADAMARGGPNLVKPVPTPVGIEYHDTSWAKGKTLA